MAGTRNQAHLAAQLRLRRQLGQHDGSWLPSIERMRRSRKLNARSRRSPRSGERDRAEQSRSDALADRPGHAGGPGGQTRSAMSASTSMVDGPVEIGVP